jgi:hypothetical protein
MSELNWIDKNERLPTKDDADRGFVVGRDREGARCYSYTSVANLPQCTHWIGMKQINECAKLPKRWRTPTIRDLAKAGKPIPCRVRDTTAQKWKTSELCAIDVQAVDVCGVACGRSFMGNCGSWYYLCEICDD